MGFLTALLRLYEPTILVGILVMVLVYVASALAIRSLLNRDVRAKLGRKLYTSGAATYVLMWLMVLILTFNILFGA